MHHSVNDPLSVKLYRSGNKEFTLNRCSRLNIYCGELCCVLSYLVVISGRVDEGVSPIFGVKRLTEEQERALVDGGLTVKRLWAARLNDCTRVDNFFDNGCVMM